MATATLTSQLTDLLLDPGAPSAVIGTGNTTAAETVVKLQGANCGASGHTGAVGPTAPTVISGFRGHYHTITSLLRDGKHLHIWLRDLYPIRNKNLGGVSVYLFGTSEAIYYSTGLDKGYFGGWFHMILNLDPTTRPAASLGTAPSANLTRVGITDNISATKAEAFLQNCYTDGIRYSTAGTGITFSGGTSGDKLNFAACVLADTASYGLLQNVGGAYFIEGCLTFGGATLTTYFQDNLKTLTFTGFEIANGASGGTIVPAVAADYYRIVLADGTTGITAITMTDVVWKGYSRAVPFSFTSSLATGDAYTSLRSTYLFGSTITLNALCTSTADSFIECVTVVPTGITLTNPTFSNCDACTLTSASSAISGGTVNKHNTTAGNAFITTDDLTKISGTAFDNTAGAGHAILINTAGTYSFSGNTFAGYGADASTSAAIYNNSGGLVTINITGGGGTPTIRNGTAASTTVQNAVTVTVTVKDASTLSVIQNARVLLEKSADGTDIMTGLTNASGVVTTSYAYTADTAVIGTVRRATAAYGTLYKPNSISGTITSAGLNVTILLNSDE